MIYVSAQSPVDPSGRVLTPGDIVAQTRQVMKQIGAALGHFGAGFDDVVKLNRWYAGGGTVADFEPAALACAAHFNEPGRRRPVLPSRVMRWPASRSRSRSSPCWARMAGICRAAIPGPIPSGTGMCICPTSTGSPARA